MNKQQQKFTLSLLVVLLAGCSMMPQYQRPEPPVPTVWPDTVKLKLAGEIKPKDWHDYFTDPRLQTLIAVALENNRDLRIATARIAEARAQYGIQRADQLPNINANAGRNASLTPAGASGFSNNAIHTQRYDVNVSLVSFELDFWGRVRSLSAAAKASYLSTEAAQRAFRLSLIADVANAYLSLQELHERTELATATVKTRAESRMLLERRREVGVSSDLDFWQADGAYQSALAELSSLERQQAAAANLLDMLLGQPLSKIQNLPTGRNLAAQSISSEPVSSLPAEVLLQRPDVMAAEQRLIAANANIGAARAAFFPRIALTGSVGTASRTLSGLFGAGSGAWSFQPTISLPLFDAGRNASNLDVAAARKVAAVAEYEKTIQQAFREVADLLNAREKLAEQLTAQQAAAQAQDQRLSLVNARYQAGIDNYLALLDAQREAFSAQQNTLQVQRALLSTMAQLYKALGRDSSVDVDSK